MLLRDWMKNFYRANVGQDGIQNPLDNAKALVQFKKKLNAYPFPYLLHDDNNAKVLCMYRGVIATLDNYITDDLLKIDRKATARAVEDWVNTKAGNAVFM